MPDEIPPPTIDIDPQPVQAKKAKPGGDAELESLTPTQELALSIAKDVVGEGVELVSQGLRFFNKVKAIAGLISFGKGKK